ncbi:uncharacterized protein Z520_00338 [Fonsecaea multimorphosa CBS 102226]|uniref:Uncharacterized protein n=1 Tax=Fonsecaea multimorphosa CBS 102226 TaxID=1442371 RepID=A0A0D2J2H7_9EURO|nr:uncharacterized protein Z520_00338 [Fonsecaea multimorphosa CBS 102226]KIY03647.1 hypothetical protein Z520_00338 [Fonsecaea multimorphosa CBS 102226]OAL32346.1 hypothetical protein AYO22_00368 [Fonsecaea multimorphosa]
MPVTQPSQLKPGQLVSIVLKADQRTGRQVQGTVSQLLTRHNHPRGIKVKLTDGRVGRVQQILTQSQPLPSSRMSSNNNPWANAESQGNPYVSHASEQQNQGSAGAAQSYYQSSHPSQNQPQQYQHQSSTPAQGINRSDTEQLLAQQSDRAEQVEHMQQYEANARQTEDDRIQAQLQKEFPNIDSSLIAAIYNERKGQGDLGEVRELLQELNTT